MCIILDANMLSKFKRPADEDMGPVWQWLRKENNKIAYSTTEKFKQEWTKGGGDNLMRELERSKKFKSVSDECVLEKQKELEGKIKSNDLHIIAVAIIAKAKRLVSSDRDLSTDFKNSNLVGGKVYQNKTHAHLLRRYQCPD